MKYDIDLTSVKQELLDNLLKAFDNVMLLPETINLTEQKNTPKRFTLETIKLDSEMETMFYDMSTKFNETMVKAFVESVENDIADFKKEFGEFIDVTFESLDGNKLDKFLVETNDNILGTKKYKKLEIFFISKKNPQNLFSINVGYEEEKVVKTLNSGKEIYAYKIKGMSYCFKDDRLDENNKRFSTLDKMLQNHNPFKERIYELVK
jgi:hypothetical protein